MSERTWESNGGKGDAADIDPGVTHNRTNEEYNRECREALEKSDPGKIREW